MVKRIICSLWIVGLLVSCGKGRRDVSHELLVCGDNKVWIIDKDASEGDDVVVLWKWENSDLADVLPEAYQRYLSTMDECKFVDNNTKVLLTASTGGVVLLDRATQECLFYAYAPMAHSADLLPGNRIAVALSTHPKGNSIELYDIKRPESVLWKDSLYSGHGSVWMKNRNRYYALGFDELREYSLQDWQSDHPALKLERTWTIPYHGGHDLTAISGHELMFSGHHGVGIFDIDRESFSPFEPLDSIRSVKSVNYDPSTGSLIYTKAEESWWTFNIYMQNPNKVIHIPEIKMYKVRTNPF